MKRLSSTWPTVRFNYVVHKDGDVNLEVLGHTFVARANAYSATTVFPADVCAATNTESPFSR